MINHRLFVKLIIVVVILVFSIPTLLMIYGDFQTLAESKSEFDLSQFSALITLHAIGIDSQFSFIQFLHSLVVKTSS